VRGIYQQIRDLGGEVLVVSFSPPARVAAYLDQYPQPFPVVSDPSRAAYRAFALGRTGPASFFRPDILLRYLGLIVRGWLPRTGDRGDDLLQLGGDFLLGADGRLRYAHPSRNSTDRPAPKTLLEALRRPVVPTDAG
jgi:AhpC/TSA antioxidant enzyme